MAACAALAAMLAAGTLMAQTPGVTRLDLQPNLEPRLLPGKPGKKIRDRLVELARGTQAALRIGLQPMMRDDEHFRDHVLFYEYFDGDTGRGVGASHQTGWTGLVAKLLKPRR